MSRVSYLCLAALALGGCGASVGDDPTPPGVEQELVAARAVSLAASASVALFEPFFGDDNVLPQIMDEMNRQELTTANGLRWIAEISGTTGPCAEFAWSAEEGAVITYEDCDFAAPGLLINGSMKLKAEPDPSRLLLTLDGLRVDDVVFDGELTLFYLPGGGSLVGEVTFQVDGETMNIGVDGLEVTLQQDTATIRGDITFDSRSFSGKSASSSLLLVSGECTPRGGAIQLQLDGHETVGITYLFDTPTSGQVDLLVGGQLFPSQPILAPCG